MGLLILACFPILSLLASFYLGRRFTLGTKSRRRIVGISILSVGILAFVLLHNLFVIEEIHRADKPGAFYIIFFGFLLILGFLVLFILGENPSDWEAAMFFFLPLSGLIAAPLIGFGLGLLFPKDDLGTNKNQ